MLLSPAHRTAATGSFLIAAAILILSGPGEAQVIVQDGDAANFAPFGSPGFRQLLAPDFLRRDAAILVGELGLTSDQRYVIEMILEDYTKGFDSSAAPLRDAMKQRGPLGGQVARVLGPDAAAGIEGAVMPAVREALGGEAGWIGNSDVNVMMLDDGGGVMTFVSSGEPPPGFAGASDAGQGQVMIRAEVHVASDDGEHLLPDDVRARIEESLKRHLEERLQQRAQDANDPAQVDPPPAAGDAPPVAGTPAPTPRTSDEIAALASALLSTKIAARNQLIEDVAGVLAPEQTERWPAAQRTLRRLHSLPRGRLSGERLDLTQIFEKIVGAAELPRTITEQLAQYAIRLDAALAMRDEFLSRSEIDLFRAREDANRERQSQIQDSQGSQRLVVRNVNEEFTGLIASALTPEQADAFRKAVKEASYDRVFRQTRTQRVFNAAEAIEGLDPAVLQTVKALEESYLAELNAANERLVTITRDNEPRQDSRRAEKMAAMVAALRAGQEPPPPSDPIADEFARRNQLGRSYLDRLKGALTPEQFDSLPGATGAKQTLEFPSGTFIQRIDR